MGLSERKTKHPHIVRIEGVCGGSTIIKGTRTPVRSIAGYYNHLGYSVEEILRQLSHLTPAEVHDALSYYYDNQEEIDREIEENSEEALMKKYPQTVNRYENQIVSR